MGTGLTEPAPHQHGFSVTKLFDESCPYYIAIGMTYDEYWNGSGELAKVYRKAYQIKQKQRNEELWLQGLYIYDAIRNLTPVLNPLSKKPEPYPYNEEPYPITAKDLNELKEKKERERVERLLDYMKTKTQK